MSECLKKRGTRLKIIDYHNNLTYGHQSGLAHIRFILQAQIDSIHGANRWIKRVDHHGIVCVPNGHLFLYAMSSCHDRFRIDQRSSTASAKRVRIDASVQGNLALVAELDQRQRRPAVR